MGSAKRERKKKMFSKTFICSFIQQGSNTFIKRDNKGICNVTKDLYLK